MDNQRLEINILPADHGDCIHLRFYSVNNEVGQTKQNVNQAENQEGLPLPTPPAYRWYNIVIDSGPAKHKHGFARLMHSIRDRMDNWEKVDLLCFTHVDDDHMLAAERFFGNPDASERASEYIKKIWINIPKKAVEEAEPKPPRYTQKLSADSAFDLYSYILWHKIPCDTWVSTGEPIDFGEVKIQVVRPTSDLLADYQKWWEEKRPTEKMSADSDDLEEPVDPSKTNGSSIVLLVEAFGSKLLFSGDAYADELESVAQAYAGDGFTLVKLPHHGSKANTSQSMLDAMKCECFVISANGTQRELEKKRPSLQTIELLYKHCPGATLYGNYNWEYVTDWVADQKLDGVNIVMLSNEQIQIADRITIRTEPMK